MGGRKGLTADIVAQAAQELVEEQGLEQLTVQKLAGRLGIRPASLYNHMGGVQALLRELSMRTIRRLEESIRDAAVGRSGDDAVRAAGGAYRRFAKEHPELYKIFIRSASLEDPEVHEAGRAIARVLRQILSHYPCPDEMLLHITRGLRSALHGFVSLEAAGFFYHKPDVEESFALMIDTHLAYLNGCRGPHDPAPGGTS